MLKILFVSSASHGYQDRNLNHFQRAYFLSRAMNLSIAAVMGADFSLSTAPGTKILHASRPEKPGVILYILKAALRGDLRQYDLIITEPSVLGICGFLGKLFGTKKWVVDVWDIPIRCYMQMGPIGKLRCKITKILMKLAYRYADLFILSIIPDFEFKYFRIPEEKLFLLGNAIWQDEEAIHTNKKNNTFNILCMRSIHTSDMGLDVLASAYGKLNQRIDNLKYTIIGKIPDNVRQQTTEIENANNVEFYPFVEPDTLKSMIRDSSVCVIPFKNTPDLAQTYPVKVLEYLYQGKAVVASDIKGISQIIKDKENGLLFPAGDSNSLSECILQLYYGKDLLNSIESNARASIQKFDCRVKNALIIERLCKLTEE